MFSVLSFFVLFTYGRATICNSSRGVVFVECIRGLRLSGCSIGGAMGARAVTVRLTRVCIECHCNRQVTRRRGPCLVARLPSD